MTGVRFPSIDDYNDIAMKNKYAEEVAKGRNPQEVLESLQPLSRDNSRTPMQWDDSENAGFTTGTPWIKVNPNYKEINVKQALEDPNSVYHYYRKLIQLRKEHPEMVYGTFHDLTENEPYIYAYTRELDDNRLLIVLNHCDEPNDYELPSALSAYTRELVLGNYAGSQETGAVLHMRPHEARIYTLKHD